MTQAPLSVPCPRCAAVLPPTANFCRRCGIGLTRPPIPSSGVPNLRPVSSARPVALMAAATTTTKPLIPKRQNKSGGMGLWPVILICVFGLNALRAYQRSTTTPHFAPLPPVRIPSPTPTPLFTPHSFTPITPPPAAPAQSPSSVDELHWNSTPRWSTEPASRDADPWHPSSSRNRPDGRGR